MKGDHMGILAADPTQRELPLSNWARFRRVSQVSLMPEYGLRPACVRICREHVKMSGFVAHHMSALVLMACGRGGRAGLVHAVHRLAAKRTYAAVRAGLI